MGFVPMKLYQIITVDGSGGCTVKVSPNILKEHRFFAGPIDLSFHPYLLCLQTLGDESVCLEKGLTFKLMFTFVDEQNHENAFSDLAPSKSFLLLAEFNEGLVELMNHLDFHLNEVTINKEGKYTISLNLKRQIGFHNVVLLVVALREGIDSLLYSRGLMRKMSTLIVNPELIVARHIHTLNQLIANDNC